MTILHNSIIINAPLEKIWGALSDAERLAAYDPAVKIAVALTHAKNGVGAKRKVTMQDNKNWFEEKVRVWKPGEALTYELTACSFPVERLEHRYSFEDTGGQTKVTQRMEYEVKFGLFGKLLDTLMIRKRTDRGIKNFLAGLKSYTEKK